MDPFDPSFLWIVILGFVLAFFDSFGIGSNDVANAFATSVSSKSLTLKKACTIAIFTELAGAVLLGGSTTSAIKGVVREEIWEDRPDLLMLVMLSSLVGSSSWVIFASSRGWPVSTTHATVGGLAGAAMTAFGPGALKWTLDEDKSMLEIVIGWIASPIIAGIVGSLIFFINKYAVLVRRNSFSKAGWAVCFWFAVTAAIAVLYLSKKAPGLKQLDLTPTVQGFLAAVAFVYAGMWSCFCYVPWVRRIVKNGEDLKWYHVFITPIVKPKTTSAQTLEEGKTGDSMYYEDKPLYRRFWEAIKAALLQGVHRDVITHKGDLRVQECMTHTTTYDPKTEKFFSHLQVLTAMLSSFAHGSNDVANAIGPLSTIYSIWRTGEFNRKVDTPIPILVYGGIAIDVGLFMYGYKVMRNLGNRITYQTPSRGFCAELGAAFTVLTASYLALPVSTTHSLVGATTGVGIASNGSFRAVNWRILCETIVSWVATVPAAGLVSAAVFGFGGYAPNVNPS